MPTTWFKVAFIGAALVLLGAVGATADSCFQDNSSRVIVLKGSVSVGKNACKSVKGFFSGTNEVVSGAACGTSDNATIRVNVTYGDAYSGTLGTYAFSVARTTLAGAGYIYVASAQAAYGIQVSRTSCTSAAFY